MKELFDKLVRAYRPDQVLEVLEEMSEARVRFEPVGGRRNNLATINIGCDPAAGVTERITNAIDAVLESEFILRNQADEFKTPRGAVESWFGIEGGRISKIPDAQDSRIKQLSGLIK